MRLIKEISVFLAIIGLIILAVGGKYVIPKFIDNENRIETKGIVERTVDFGINTGGSHKVAWISYEVNGKAYESMLNGYKGDLNKGKEIDIYYYKDNINKIISKNDEMMLLVIPGIGLALFIIGMIGIDYCIRREKRIKGLRETGEMIETRYLETVYNIHNIVEGRHPYYILCGWKDPETNIKYVFTSENMLFNPEKRIKEKEITKFPVYINMKRKSEYLVDITELTGTTVEINL